MGELPAQAGRREGAEGAGEQVGLPQQVCLCMIPRHEGAMTDVDITDDLACDSALQRLVTVAISTARCGVCPQIAFQLHPT